MVSRRSRSEFGARLVQAREHANLTQEQVAKAAGLSQSTLSGLERIGSESGKTVQIAARCGVSAWWLATGEGHMAAKRQKEEAFQEAVAYAKAIKASLKNPASFELVDAIRTPTGALCYQYRGTNSFNAVVPNYAVIPPGGKGAVSGPTDQVATAWNKHCAGQSGESMRHVRQAL